MTHLRVATLAAVVLLAVAALQLASYRAAWEQLWEVRWQPCTYQPEMSCR